MLLLVFWAMCLLSIPIWGSLTESGWDTKIYMVGVRSIEAGRDPYADATAHQREVHKNVPPFTALAGGPCSYVYSPMTIPLVRIIGALPTWFTGSVFAILYFAGILAELWFGIQFFTGTEKRSLAWFVPLAIFFPGFLGADTVLSGNVAPILYGTILTSTVFAWRSGRWRWFYVAVLAASCFKAPLLSLLAIPVFSARRQWLPAFATGAAGVALFAMQPVIWPTLFKHFLDAVELQFSFNRDFGSSPAGLLGGYLFDHHISYSPWVNIFFLLYLIPLAIVLFLLSRRFFQGDFTLQQWAPVLLVGTFLLNPRLLEYDVAAIAIPLAIIAWRVIALFAPSRRILLCFVLLFATVNSLALLNWSMWKLTEGPLLVVFFAAGAWSLFRQRPVTAQQSISPQLAAIQT